MLDVPDAPGGGARELPAIEWPEAQEYLRRMKEWGTRASWGGMAELAVLAGMSGRRIFLAERHRDWVKTLAPLREVSKEKSPAQRVTTGYGWEVSQKARDSSGG